jgi:hypothetical protein
MRRSLATFMAAATAIAATATFIPAQAAPVSPTVLATVGIDSGSVQQIRDWRRDDHRRGGDDNWRHRHHHRHDNGGFSFPFYFGFPFAPQAYYQRPYQPYYGYGDCFRTWDGQLICR